MKTLLPVVDWRPDDTAICAQVDAELFFPEVGGRGARDAMRMCAGCPLINPCRDYALAVVVDGVWGGTTPRQRQKIRNDAGIVAVDLYPARQPAPCGTDAAKARHRRAGETCQNCYPQPDTTLLADAYREQAKHYGKGYSCGKKRAS